MPSRDTRSIDRRRRVRWRSGGLTSLAIGVLLTLSPPAFADAEPNDGITQAEGSLAGGTVYSGAHANRSDPDWYLFYVSGQTQLDVAVTTPGGSPCSNDVYLRDTDGYRIAEAYVYANATSHLRYTTPSGTNRFLLHFPGGCDGGSYQFSIAPAAAVVAGPGVASPSATGEPNETAAQAQGPLGGGILYGGAIQTQNDADWFYFFTSGTSAFDLALTNPGECGAEAELYRNGDGSTGQIDSTSPSGNQTGHVLFTPSGAAKYLIKVTGCTGAAYQFRIDPPAALAPGLPAPTPPPSTLTPASAPAPTRAPVTSPAPSTRQSARCAGARRSSTRWTRSVARTQRQLKRTRRASRKRALRRTLAAQRRTLRRVKDKVTLLC